MKKSKIFTQHINEQIFQKTPSSTKWGASRPIFAVFFLWKMFSLIFSVNIFNFKIDFLNIDVEGADIDVLESLDFHKYSPELICVEVNQKNNEDSQIFKFLKKRGYQKIWSGVFSHVFKRT